MDTGEKDMPFYFVFIIFEVLLQLISVTHAYLVIDEPFMAIELCCPSVGDRTIITDRERRVPWGDRFRAFKTAPLSVMVAPSNIPDAGYGVISRTFIKRYTWLGEYEGEIIPMEGKDRISYYTFVVRRGGMPDYLIDSLNINTASYLRFLNCPRNRQEENVRPFECRGRLYFITFKDVAPGQELLVYYGHLYARHLGIDYKLFIRNRW